MLLDEESDCALGIAAVGYILVRRADREHDLLSCTQVCDCAGLVDDKIAAGDSRTA